MTTCFCPDCDAEMSVEIDDCSFDHEFGVERVYDWYCCGCNRLLRTTKSKPKPEFEEPD